MNKKEIAKNKPVPKIKRPALDSKIFLEEKPLEFSSRDLPVLITYRPGTGGSLFSLFVIRDLMQKKHKILFFCAFSEGREKFLKLIGPNNRGKVALVTNQQQLKEAHNYQVALIESGDEKLLLESLKTLKGKSGRLIFVKNMENLRKSTFQKLKNFPKVIFSGDLDKCLDKTGIAKRGYRSMIFFSRPKIFLPFKFPDLKKFQGYLWSSRQSGVVELR
jgi:hypothetical protein